MKKNISGVIKLGQLKRIQAVLHRNWNVENRFENRNWKEELEFIRNGRGEFIPVTISVDFGDNINNEILKFNLKKTKFQIESILKLTVLQKFQNSSF